MWIESVLQMCMVSWPGQLGEYCSLKSRLDVLSSCSCNWNLATKHCQEKGKERVQSEWVSMKLNWIEFGAMDDKFSSVEFSWVKLSDCVSVGPRVFDWWRHFPFQKFAPPTRSPSRVLNWLDSAACAAASDSGAGHVEPQWSYNWEKGEERKMRWQQQRDASDATAAVTVAVHSSLRFTDSGRSSNEFNWNFKVVK